METPELAILEADLQEHMRLIGQLYERIRQRFPHFKDSPETVDSMAYQLHNLFGAYEEIFGTVANHFENHVSGARYHADLLRRMRTPIRGIRPALLSQATWEALDELRRFRHFFRHAYGAELIPERTEAVCRIAMQLEGWFRQDLERFLRELETP